jgi:hypothetical protein
LGCEGRKAKAVNERHVAIIGRLKEQPAYGSAACPERQQYEQNRALHGPIAKSLPNTAAEKADHSLPESPSFR